MDINLLLNFLWQSWVTEMIWKKRDVGFNLRVQFAHIKKYTLLLLGYYSKINLPAANSRISVGLFRNTSLLKKRESEGKRMDEY